MGPVALSEMYVEAFVSLVVDNLTANSYRDGGAAVTDSLFAHGVGNATVADNILFNGKNVNSNGTGDRFAMTFQPNKNHLIRLVNVGSANYYKVGIGRTE